MENNIKRVMEEIEVPLQKLDAAIDKGITKTKKKTRRPLKVGMLSSIAIISLLLGAGFVSPTVSNALSKVPFVGVVYKIEEQDKGLYQALSDNHVMQLNQTVTSNDIAVTFEKIVYDGARINVIYSMDTYYEIGRMDIFVNGQWVNSGGSIHTLDDENGLYRAIYEFKISEQLPDQFDIKVAIDMLDGQVGNWEIETPIKKIENNHQVLQAGQKGSLNEIPFEVIDIQTSTTSTKLQVKFTGDLNGKFDEPLAYSIAETITDQNGVPLAVRSKTGEGKSESDVTWTYMLEPLDASITELHLYYYEGPAIDPATKNNIIPLAENLPQKVALGEMGSIVIDNVQKHGEEAVLTFHIDSEFPFDGNLKMHPFNIIKENGESVIIDFSEAIGPNEYQLKYKMSEEPLFIKTKPLAKMVIEPDAHVVLPIK